ncbi:MAG: AAA family ATPase [Lachnospiraceae bacterium]|nr:AAA family ATPase [Lachnospiraceae bacterium]
MRLLSCHIENFGKLHEFDMDFDNGLNVILQDNGWGKSSLAAFLKVMFYGFAGDAKRSISDNERKRFKPWQGGTYGGRIVFEKNGKTYLLTRIFGEKELEDSFELRDYETNLISKDFSTKIGEELFGINRESFMRSVFIGQNDSVTSSTDDIASKVGKLVDDSDDLSNYDNAVKTLTEKLNALTPRRATGSISRRKDEITKYERMVKEGEGIRGSIEEQEKKLEMARVTLKQLLRTREENSKLQKQLSEEKAKEAVFSERERLKAAVAAKDTELNNNRKNFKDEVPPMDEINGILPVSHSLKSKGSELASYTLTGEEKNLLSYYEKIFESGIPDETTINAVSEKCSELIKTEQLLASEGLTGEEEEVLEKTAYLFPKGDEEIKAAGRLWNERNEDVAELKAICTGIKDQDEKIVKANKGKMLPIAVLAVGAVLLVAGLIMLISGSRAEGSSAAKLVLACAGAVAVIAGIILYISNRNELKNLAKEGTELRQKRSDLELKIKDTQVSVEEFLDRFGIEFNPEHVQDDLMTVSGRYAEINALRSKKEKAASSGTAERKDGLKEEILSFLGTYTVTDMLTSTPLGSINGDFLKGKLHDLEGACGKYRTLSEKEQLYDRTVGEYTHLRQQVEEFFKKYGFGMEEKPDEQLLSIRDMADDYYDAVKNLKEAQKTLADFEELKKEELKETSGEHAVSLKDAEKEAEKINASIDNAKQNILAYESRLDGLRESLDEWEELGDILKELKLEQEEEKKLYKYTSTAKDALVKAKETMTSRYVKPLLASLKTYYKTITGLNPEVLHMDANTNITIDEAGLQRDAELFSTGYRDLFGIALRVAFADAMYTEEIPFLIMDDPFVNLDDSKLKNVREFLKVLAEKYQILYFTCSNSR